VQRQMFSNEVWAMGGAHITSYITQLKDGSERYLPECLTHKYRKQPAWMFHRSIINGKKGPAIFWEKKWGSMDSFGYDYYILSRIEE
jgi:hypothetical protein